MEAEYFTCQVINFLAAYIGANELPAQSITSSAEFLAFQISFALSIAVGTRMGQSIGQNSIHNCKFIIRAASVMSIGLSLFNFLCILLNRRRIGKLFTYSDDVIIISDRTLTYSAFNQISDVINVASVAILRAQGRQKAASCATFICYFFISSDCLLFEQVYAFRSKRSMVWLYCWCNVFSGYRSVPRAQKQLESNFWASINHLKKISISEIPFNYGD